MTTTWLGPETLTVHHPAPAMETAMLLVGGVRQPLGTAFNVDSCVVCGWVGTVIRTDSCYIVILCCLVQLCNSMFFFVVTH